MAPQSMGQGSAMPPSEWQSSARICTRSQQVALMRAAVIALVLLAILVVIVLL